MVFLVPDEGPVALAHMSEVHWWIQGHTALAHIAMACEDRLPADEARGMRFAGFSWTQPGRTSRTPPQLTGQRNEDPYVDLAERPLPWR